MSINEIFLRKSNEGGRAATSVSYSGGRRGHEIKSDAAKTSTPRTANIKSE